MTTWLTILGMVAVTYTIRLSVIALLGETTLSPAVHSALRYVPPAALSGPNVAVAQSGRRGCAPAAAANRRALAPMLRMRISLLLCEWCGPRRSVRRVLRGEPTPRARACMTHR